MQGGTEYNGGFRSMEGVTGAFQFTFTTPGTYYYISGGFGHIGELQLHKKYRSSVKTELPYQWLGKEC